MITKTLKYCSVVFALAIFGAPKSSVAQETTQPAFHFYSVWWAPEYHEGQDEYNAGRALTDKGEFDLSRGRIAKGESEIHQGENLMADGQSKMNNARIDGPEYYRPWHHWHHW